MKYFLLLLCCFVLFPRLYAVEGTVHLSNGKSHTGKISLSHAISFRDIFRQKDISLSLSQIYRISLLEEGIYGNVPFDEDLAAHSRIEKKYLMGVTTWEGKIYWGYFNCRVTIRDRAKTLKFTLSHTQTTNQLKLSELYYIKELVCQPPKDGAVPSDEESLSLCGSIHPKGVFKDAYAVHYQLGIIFPGQISEEGGWYSFANIVPGNYDLIFSGERNIVFAMSPPMRKDLMDNEVNEESLQLISWLENTGNRGGNRRTLYLSGRRSDARAIVSEEFLARPEKLSLEETTPKKGLRLFWLCLASWRGHNFAIKNFQLLSRQELTVSPPQLCLDPRLSNIVVPLDGGKRRYDCLWED